VFAIERVGVVEEDEEDEEEAVVAVATAVFSGVAVIIMNSGVGVVGSGVAVTTTILSSTAGVAVTTTICGVTSAAPDVVGFAPKRPQPVKRDTTSRTLKKTKNFRDTVSSQIQTSDNYYTGKLLKKFDLFIEISTTIEITLSL
jgi:hypothetical protein